MPREVDQKTVSRGGRVPLAGDAASGMGSFDFVRLAPHCAQDDNFLFKYLPNSSFSNQRGPVALTSTMRTAISKLDAFASKVFAGTLPR